MTSGTVVDIRTGRALGRTRSLTEHFANAVQSMLEADEQFYLVHGRCRSTDVRDLITELKRILDTIPIIYDPQFKADTIWIFSGEPEELGFAV